MKPEQVERVCNSLIEITANMCDKLILTSEDMSDYHPVECVDIICKGLSEAILSYADGYRQAFKDGDKTHKDKLKSKFKIIRTDNND